MATATATAASAASLDLSELAPSLRDTGTWAAALLHAMARDEAAGRRTERLTEPNLATWMRFRGRLTASDFVALLFEDAAVQHAIPFDASVMSPSLQLEHLPEGIARSWLHKVPTLSLKGDGQAYIAAQAKLLGLPTRLGRSALQSIKSVSAHQKILELPGTGGQLAHHLLSTQTDLTLQNNCTIAGTTWQEMTLAAVVGLELGAPHSEFVARLDVESFRRPEHPLRKQSFDFVLGLHPDKGGLFQYEDQLAIWFPNATVVLV